MTQSNEMSELVTRAVAGDRTATEQLFVREYDNLKNHIRRQIPNDLNGVVSSEDILQQTFAKAFKAIGNFTPTKAGIGPWLRTIASNQLRDTFRRRNLEIKNHAKRPADAAKDPKSTFRILLERFNKEEDFIPQNLAMREELLSALNVALANLNDEHRQAIRYRYLEEKSLKEIAGLMDRTEAGVRGLCYRAKSKLRNELERLSKFI